jgi:signal transduction histidine kinase
MDIAGTQVPVADLAACIAHEINTPLAALVTRGEASLRWLGAAEPDIGEASRLIRGMVADARRTSDVVVRLAGLLAQAHLTCAAIDVNALLRGAAARIAGDLSQHDTKLRFDLAEDLPGIRGDQVLLEQLVCNLAMNGIQAMAGSSLRPRELLLRTRRAGTGLVHFSVRDRGPGIHRDVRRRMFDRNVSTKPAGMGLGLHICRLIVSAHGGRIWAAESAGPGATLTVALPGMARSAA